MSLPPLTEVNVSVHPVTAATDNLTLPDASAPSTVAPASSATQAPTPVYWDDQLYLEVGGTRLSGWTGVQVLRGLDVTPSMFRVIATDLQPDDASQAAVKAFDPVKVYIDEDLVITGYVDRVTRDIGPQGSRLTITGRGAVCDLIDCDVDPDQLPGMQLSNMTLLDMATKLAGQYGVTVRTVGSPPNPVIKQRNITLGEKPFDVIEEAARYAQVIVYDDFDGALVLAAVDAGSMASGFEEGVNIEKAQGVEAGDQRFSDIAVYMVSANQFAEAGPLQPAQLVQDQTVTRKRKHIVVSEQASLDIGIAKRRGLWEVATRYGRSQPITLTTDTWRDSAGTLWRINTLAEIDVPHLRVTGKQWLIAQVTFRRDETGTHADIALMPKQAFLPEPTILLPFDAQTAQGLTSAGTGAK